MSCRFTRWKGSLYAREAKEYELEKQKRHPDTEGDQDEHDHKHVPALFFHVFHCRSHYWIFNVERPRMANSPPRIHIRVTTLLSCQPLSSKWWCSGAILNTRLPVSLKEITWMLTERVSRTNTPPRIRIRISFFNIRADDAQHPAQGQAARVPHPHVRGVCVEPEKPDGRTDHREGEDGDLAAALDERDLQVVGEIDAPADVGQDVKREAHHDDQADRQPVQAVGEVHCVGVPDHQDDGERDVAPRTGRPRPA